MDHLKKAYQILEGKEINNSNYHFGNFVYLNKAEVTFNIQDGPIKEVGVNGVQVSDMLEFCLEVFKSLNETFPCRENNITITKLEEALHWQDHRTKDRIKRQVEGLNKV